MAIKLTANLPESTVATLKEIAEQRGTTMTEVLRQAIESTGFLESEIRKGKDLLIHNPKDKTTRQILFNVPPQTVK